MLHYLVYSSYGFRYMGICGKHTVSLIGGGGGRKAGINSGLDFALGRVMQWIAFYHIELETQIQIFIFKY